MANAQCPGPPAPGARGRGLHRQAAVSSTGLVVPWQGCRNFCGSGVQRGLTGLLKMDLGYSEKHVHQGPYSCLRLCHRRRQAAVLSPDGGPEALPPQ